MNVVKTLSRNPMRVLGALMALCAALPGFPAASAARPATESDAKPASAGTAAPAPPPASAFGQTPDFTFVALAPDGNTIAMDRRTRNGHKVVLFRADNPQPLRVVDVGDQNKLRGLFWADARTLLVDVSATVRIGGMGQPSVRSTWEMWRTMSVGVDGGEPKMLLMDDPDRKWVNNAFVLAARSTKPHTVMMMTKDFSLAGYRQSVGTRLSNERRDSGWISMLFEVDTASGKGRPIEHGTAYTAGWLIDPDGAPIARTEWNTRPGEFTILAKDGRGWRTLFRSTGGETLIPAGVTPDGKALVALGENGTERSKAWTLPLDGSAAAVAYEHPDGDVENAIVDPYVGVIQGYVTGGLKPGYHWIDPKRASQQRALDKAFPGRDVHVSHRSSDGERVLAVASSPTQPPVTYFVDFGKGKADIVGESYPRLAGASLGEVRATTYLARDGASIPAYLTLPPGRGEKGLPLVVLPHGGPESRDDWGFDWWAQFLATRGYAVLQPQFRGSTGFGRAHRLAGYREWGGRMQDDVSDGVRHLVATGVADPQRVCIVGASYGGYAALAGAAFTPDLYACAVSVNGISDLPQMLGDISRWSYEEGDTLLYWKEHIGVATDPRTAARSPARSAGSIKAPVLLLHGQDDTVVPPGQSETMARALAAAGKPYEYVKLPGEDHWLSDGATRTRVLEEIEAFLAEHL